MMPFWNWSRSGDLSETRYRYEVQEQCFAPNFLNGRLTPPFFFFVNKETWEEDTSDIHGSWKGCVKLQRLELGHLPHLTLDTLSILLQKCSGITHLGLMGSLSYESGPEFLWNIHNWLPNLQVLDLSHTPWLTEGLVRGILEAYGCKLIVKATGSLPLTSQVTLENDYPKHFWSETNIDKLEHTFVPSNCGAAS